ncbi:MAG: gliding motility-associated C-terminal domain-containing protein [Prevotella sp.]|nr:gliding motility-associated C-terminal domain-containing protein [Prevotella sp.]
MSTKVLSKALALSLLLGLMPLATLAQKVAPTATYIDDDKNTIDAESDFSAQAPLEVMFRANPTEMGEHTPTYEWHFRKEGTTEDLLVRYEEDTQYTFVESGTFHVTLKTHLTDIDADLDSTVIKITISESKLEFPNAFSPNGDEINDIYRAKQPDGYRSIVEFHAYIFNRWGQKLYEWTDVSQGWDGTYHGSPVKEGVYFVLVKARGADGRVYNIKKDINLLRGYTEGTTSSSSTE